jgi:hypothetical protein
MTPVETIQTIQSLAPLAETLNAESDDLNTTITALSEKLANLNLGIEVWFDSNEDSEREIGFAKVEGSPMNGQGVYQGPAKARWQLATKLKKGFHPQIVPKPLEGASRDVRIEGLERVPDIVSRLRNEAQTKIRVMQEAKKLVAEL